ncbi:MAG: TonB-dependent receptor [Melioribacteraceae bacterium]|nr:TonB-dependent receptor [Melioribacteraceae bacterium]
MKKLLILIFIITNYSLLAQEDNRGQSIELPEFVITGVQSVSIPTMQKSKPVLVPTLSEEFFTPKYSPEDFMLANYSNPIKRELELYKFSQGYDGLLKIGAGLQTLPIGDFYFNKNLGQFLFDTHVWGYNIKDYIPNAAYNVSGASLGLGYFVGNKSQLFPGMQIGLYGKFYRDSYKFFGSTTPNRERKNQNINFELSFLNRLQKKLKYGLELKGNMLDMKKDDIKENNYDAKGFLELSFGNWGVGIDGDFIRQDLKDSTVNNSINNFMTGEFYLTVNTSRTIGLKVGASYSKQDSNKIFSPVIYLSFLIDEGISLYASYKQSADFITVSNFLGDNPYFQMGDVINVFQENRTNIRVAAKYEYQKFLEISAGFAYSKFNNFFYFEDEKSNGLFKVNLLDNVKRTSVFLNMLLQTDQVGSLIGNIEYQNVRSETNKFLPYNPLLLSSLIYNYDFNFNLNAKLKIEYAHDRYADLQNSIKLSDYIDLSLYLKYYLIDNLALTCSIENIINRKNYMYNDYQEKPFDLILGIDFNW